MTEQQANHGGQPRKKPSTRPVKPIADLAGRKMPHDDAAEQSVILTLFKYPERAIDLSTWLLPEHFYGEPWGLVYGAQCKVAEAEQHVDPLTVRDRLRADGVWERVGDDKLNSLDGEINLPLLDKYAEIVATKARLRRVIAEAQMVLAEAFGPIENEIDWIETLPDRFEDAGLIAEPDSGSNGKEIVTELFTDWMSPNPEQQAHLSTGIPDLDRLIRKMRPGQMIVVAAQSGVGKSALAATIAGHVVANESVGGMPAGVFVQSLEMTRKEYMERMVFGAAGVDSYKLDETNRGKIDADEWQAIIAASKSVGVDHLHIDDKSGVSPAWIRARIRRQAKRFEKAGTPLRLIVLDYAQIIKGDVEHRRISTNREQEVAQIARAVKELAKEMGVPVILLAQINKESIKENRKPRSTDLRESQGILNDADKVMLIWNPSHAARAAQYRNGESSAAPFMEHVEIIVDKNRGGSTGTIAATFYPSLTKFTAFKGTDDDLAQLRAMDPGAKKRGAK